MRLDAGFGLVMDVDCGLPAEGVPVRGVEVLDVPPEASCFVGDLVGD